MALAAFQIPSLFEVRFVDTPSGCERPHTHSSLIVSAVSGGHVSLQVHDREILLERETVVAVGPNMLHCVRHYSRDFKGIYVLELFGAPGGCGKFTALHFQMFKSHLQYGNTPYTSFTDLCQKLLSTLQESQKVDRYSRWANDFFDGRYPSLGKESSRDRSIAARIQELLDVYDGETPPFDEISRMCGLSKERCNRLFRRVYTISIQGYFLNKKAARARTLLQSDHTLADIALACGFYDQSHFTRIFKEIFQISPARYRALISEPRQSYTRKSSTNRL